MSLSRFMKKETIRIRKKNDNLGSEILGVVAYDSIEKFGEDKKIGRASCRERV